jgi:hypothetical protein
MEEFLKLIISGEINTFEDYYKRKMNNIKDLMVIGKQETLMRS